MYTEHKPLCRLCNMCNPFFYELQVFPSANVFQLVCYTATIFTTKAVDEMVNPDQRLAQLSRSRDAKGHAFFSKWKPSRVVWH
jgi:hypothetical protein